MDTPSPSMSHENNRPPPQQPAQDIKRRRRTTKHELKILEDLYAESRNPSLEARQKACKAIGFEMKALQVWLQNRRQKEKKDAGKWKPSYTATGEAAAGAATAATSSVNVNDNISAASIASTRSSCSASPPQHASAAVGSLSDQQPRVNKLQMASSCNHEDKYGVKLPPILTHNNITTVAPPHSSSPLTTQIPITLPSISTVIAESSSRDFIPHAFPTYSSNNKLSPMLRQQELQQQQQDENIFTSTRPSFQRTTSVDSARSISTTSSVSRPTTTTTAALTSQAQPSSSIQERPIKALRGTSSQYSLSIAQDGKAKMLVTEIPEKIIQQQQQKPQLPSLATAILAGSSSSSPSISSSSPSTLTFTSAGSENFPPYHHQSNLRTQSSTSTLASAPLLQSSHRQSLPFSKSSSNFGRIYSLPSLSSLSNNSASATLLNNDKSFPLSNSNNSNNNGIFSGGLRLGSPPKKSALNTCKNQSHIKENYNHTTTGSADNNNNNELWMNLDSDPIEPEDEIIMNQNKRMLNSPIKRFTSVKMEDVISSSSSSSSFSSSVSSATTTTTTTTPSSSLPVLSPHVATANQMKKNVIMKRSEVETKAEKEQQKEDIKTSKAVAFSLLHPSPSEASKVSTPSMTSILDSPSKSSISSFRNQLSSSSTNSTRGIININNQQSQIRKRSYSKTIMSRSISLDRVILHDDSTDDENSPQKRDSSSSSFNQHTQQQQHYQQPRSAGLYPSGTILGRPILSRANSHLGILHTPHVGNEEAQQPIKRAKLDNNSTLSTIVTSPRAIEGRTEASSPCGLSVNGSSLGEPDLTFSTEASQSFDGMSRGDLSDIEMEIDTKNQEKQSNNKIIQKYNSKEEIGLPVLNSINDKIYNTSRIPTTTTTTITSTPSKKQQGNTLALAAIKGHMSSPIKMGSPSKKILTEVERDCAAVLVGLGFPDVF